MNKKAQAAMEFIMTYGWAILVVLVAIGALAYFGVLSPAKFLPERCQLQAGLYCKSFKVTTSGTELIIQNTLGKDITVQTINITGESGCVNSSMNTNITNGAEATFNVGCTLASGYKLNSDVVITYDEVGGLTGQIATGVITKKVQ
ncbi:hypothetical protein KY331_03795 [Candidatus Woesearchaeota archaeon]|nr:hypothetical protein [Candidatus Woesearchaeota archaeon]